MRTQANKPQTTPHSSHPSELDSSAAVEEIGQTRSSDYITLDRNAVSTAITHSDAEDKPDWTREFIRRQLSKLDSHQDQVKITLSAQAKVSVLEEHKTIEASVTRDAEAGNYLITLSAKEVSGIATPASSPLQLFAGLGKEAKIEVKLVDSIAVEEALLSISSNKIFEAEQYSVEVGISGELSSSLSVGTALDKTTQLELLRAGAKAVQQYAARIDIHSDQTATVSSITRTQIEGSVAASPKLISSVSPPLQTEIAGLQGEMSRKILIEDTQAYRIQDAKSAMSILVNERDTKKLGARLANKLKVETTAEKTVGSPSDSFRLTEGQIKNGRVFSLEVSHSNSQYSLSKILSNSLKSEMDLAEYLSTLGTTSKTAASFRESCLGLGHSVNTGLAAASISVKACHHDRNTSSGTVYIRDRACIEASR